MDRHSWPWKKKSSSKSVTEKIDTEDSVGPLPDQGKQKNVTYVQISVDSYKHLTGLEDQVCTLKDDVKELQNQLKDSWEKLYAANAELVAKEDVANKHAKVAEEAVSGWEKADAEAAELRRQLESITLLKLTAEEQTSHLEGALKECMRQMRIVKEEEESMQRMVVIKTKQWDAQRHELEAKVSDLDHRLLRSAAENASISRTLREQSNMFVKINEEKTQVELHNELLKQKIQSSVKENSSLKYELHVLSKELDIRNEEKNMSLRSADAANKQHLEDVKTIGKLEAECQRLRGLIRKKLPGPAALAQMKQEAESWDCDSAEPQKLPYRSLVKNNRSHLSNFKADDNKEIELLTNRLAATEEDTKILKEALATRTNELQSSRDEYAKMFAKVRELEAHGLLADSCLKNDRSSEKSIQPMTADSLELMDDFLEMEKMACMEDKSDKVVSVSSSSTNKKTETSNHYPSDIVSYKNEINDQQIVTALSYIHQFVVSLNKRSMQVLGASSTLGKELTKDCESFSDSVRKLLTNKIGLAVFTMHISNLLLQANACEGEESTNSDCIDKILLVENEVDSKQVFSLHSPTPGSSVLISEQIKSEKNNMEALESTKMQLEETLLLLSNLKAELASSRKLNSLASTQVKCMAESYKSLEVRLEESETNLKNFQAKAEDLNNLLQQEKCYRQDALVKCNDLEQKLHRRWSCPKCSLSPNADDMKSKQEREIAAAAAKLVECQESINLLGKQLKSFQPASTAKETPAVVKRLNESPAKHNRSASSLQGAEREKTSPPTITPDIMAPKRANVRKSLESQLNTTMQEHLDRTRAEGAGRSQEVRNRMQQMMAQRNPQPNMGGNAYDNDNFLEQCSDLQPIQQDWEENVDSDETLSPDPAETPQPSHARQPSYAPSHISPSDIGSSSRRGRGKNKNTAIGNLPPGQKMPLIFNAHGRPCCGNSVHWARHIGRVIRDPNVLPHTLRLWSDLSQSQLNGLWQAITDPFVAAPEHIDTYRQPGLAHADKIWNGWRVKLRARYITPFDTDKQAVRNNPPPEFNSADWNLLLDRHFFTDEFKLRSERNALNRSRVTYVNHGGSINFPQVEERMERTLGHRPDLAEFFLASHSKKTKSDDGSARLVSSEEVQSKANELGEASAANTNMSRFEVVESVFGRQTHGRVVALGSGLTPTSFRSDQRGSASSSSSTQQRRAFTQALHEENQKLREDITHIEAQMQADRLDRQRQMEADRADVQRQMDEMRAQMQAEMNAQMQRQMTEMFARFGAPPPPPPY